MDETTPHLHLNLIPIADDRLCAKTLFDRKELQNLQTDFHSAVGKKWNLQRGKEGSQANDQTAQAGQVPPQALQVVGQSLEQVKLNKRLKGGNVIEQTT